MAEDFRILIEPPTPYYKTVVRSTFEALAGLEWKLERVLFLTWKGSDRKWKRTTALSVHKPGNLSLVLAADGALAEFVKNGRYISLAANAITTGCVELVSDMTFFKDHGGSIREFRELFSKIPMPGRTRLLGDTDGRLLLPHKRRKSRLRPEKRAGLHWIEQLSALEWKRLLESEPSMVEAELTRIGDTHIVMMWKSPYDWFEERGRSRTLVSAIVNDAKKRGN